MVCGVVGVDECHIVLVVCTVDGAVGGVDEGVLFAEVVVLQGGEDVVGLADSATVDSSIDDILISSVSESLIERAVDDLRD